jgi:SAM-dependent methyltransferase
MGKNLAEVKNRIPLNKENHLDIGANAGDLLAHSWQNCHTKNLYGVEINKEAVARAKEKYKDQKNFEFHHGSADQLPFEDNKFDILTATEVIEHIPTELRRTVIKELHRVIREDGQFIVTVPHRGLFHFLDPSNYRFIAPKLFWAFSRLVGGKSRDAGFENEKHGVVWHHHFTMEELEEIFSPEFEIRDIRWRGCLIIPVIDWITFPFYRWNLTQSWLFKFLKRIQRLEFRLINNKFLGYNVLFIAYPKKQ